MTVEQRPAWYQDFPGYIREGIEEARGSRAKDEFGRPTSGGLVEGIVGGMVGADDGSDYRQAADNKRNKEKYKARIEALKGTFTPGLSEGEYEAQIIQLNDERTDDRYPKTAAGRAETARTKVQQDANKLATDKLTATIQQSNADRQAQTQQHNATNQRLLAGQAQSHQLALITAADSRDAAAQQLELQRQQMIREDQRYNERQEKLDRKDRREGVSNLVAGLAALGAAFAI